MPGITGFNGQIFRRDDNDAWQPIQVKDLEPPQFATVLPPPVPELEITFTFTVISVGDLADLFACLPLRGARWRRVCQQHINDTLFSVN